VGNQRKVLNDAKQVLGDTTMTDHSIVDRIISLMGSQENMRVEGNQVVAQLLDRHQMQIEDLNGLIHRL